MEKLPDIIGIFLVQLKKDHKKGSLVTGGIGIDGKLLYRDSEVPGDLARFKKYSGGRTIVFGPGTYNGLFIKPLPHRNNIVVSRSYPSELTEIAPKLYHINDLDNAVLAAREHFPEQEIVVGGGEPVYKKLIPQCKYLIVTEVYGDKEADRFVTIPKGMFKEIERIEHEHNGLKYDFVIYERIVPVNPELESDGS